MGKKRRRIPPLPFTLFVFFIDEELIPLGQEGNTRAPGFAYFDIEPQVFELRACAFGLHIFIVRLATKSFHDPDHNLGP